MLNFKLNMSGGGDAPPPKKPKDTPKPENQD